MDVDAISPGSDFVAAIEEAVGRCDALIAVIGEKWLTASGESGRRRLDEERDWVRVEIRTALSRGVRVIPTLVENTPMPRPEDLPADLRDLATRNAIRVSHERFAGDMERLFDSLSTFVPWYRRTRPLAVARRLFLAVGGLATLVITAWVALRWAAGLPPLAFGQEAIAERWLERQHRETGCVFVGSPQFRRADVVGSPEADLIALYYLEGCGGGNDYSTHLAVFESMGGAIEFVTDAVVGGKWVGSVSLAAIDDRTLILQEHQYLEDDPSFEPSLPRIMRCRVEDRALVCTSSQAPVESQQPPRP